MRIQQIDVQNRDAESALIHRLLDLLMQFAGNLKPARGKVVHEVGAGKIRSALTLNETGREALSMETAPLMSPPAS